MAIPTQQQVTAALGRNFSPETLQFGNYPGFLWCGFQKAGVGSAKIEFRDGWANWTDIQSELAGTGWLSAAHTWVRAEFPGLGMAYLECSGGTPALTVLLKQFGSWIDIDSGRLRWSAPYV